MSLARMSSLLAVTLLVGCAASDRSAGFGDVQQTIASRTGKHIAWNQHTPDDAQAAGKVDELLAAELTVEAAVQVALLNNRRLQASYEELGIAQADLVQAGLLRNPVFSAEIMFPVDGGPTDLAMNVAQDFLTLLYIPMRKRIAAAHYEAAKHRITETVIDLATQTRVTFHRLQASQQRLEMHEQILEATSASYVLAQRMREAGNITALTLAVERAQFEQTRLDVADAEAGVLEAREQLSALMGVWGTSTQWQVTARMADVPDEETNLDAIESRTVSASLQLAQTERQIVALGEQLGVTEATALLPDAELGVGGEREDGEWKVGPAFTLPIPLFDQGQARRERARAELRQAQELYAATAIELRSAARAARNRMLAARERAIFHRNVMLPLRSAITEETQLQYNAMQLGVFELLQVRQQEIRAGQSYIESLYEYWAARAELEALLQGGSPSAASPRSTESQPVQSATTEGH